MWTTQAQGSIAAAKLSVPACASLVGVSTAERLRSNNGAHITARNLTVEIGR
ncbi:hypothetical protein PSU4_49760 [Pseudonocardia sulfidoxydans NBRC 16205]|uniref:Uncharacterized protein n=1 Tax=Pseudonocardia sulfidoxydans NBRC 16205 TaxID=1223511 RepID=A0A511DMI0_9PSEU|nr:hypothetical protein PSU4_49760 [Pseudonocardia sulfidoxydans NBRC 16205]